MDFSLSHSYPSTHPSLPSTKCFSCANSSIRRDELGSRNVLIGMQLMPDEILTLPPPPKENK
jgi:hypothetical protein